MVFRVIPNVTFALRKSSTSRSAPLPTPRLLPALSLGGLFSSSAQTKREMSCTREIESLWKKAKSNPRSMTDEEWSLILTPQQYHVTREKGTERPFSCARVNDNHQKGQYNCICCGVPLFTSGTNYYKHKISCSITPKST